MLYTFGHSQLTLFFFLQYCEYMPDMAKCRQWLEKNFPNEFAKLTVGKYSFFDIWSMGFLP